MRSTLDIDTSIRNRDLSLENALRDDMEYPGIRISMNAVMEKMITPIKLDISTGDAITPRAIEYQYPLMLEDRTIKLWSYNLETVLAEKIQTVLVRERANTRMRDFYDIYTLLNAYSRTIDKNVLKAAYAATCNKRESTSLTGRETEIITNIECYPVLSEFWEKYRQKHAYALEITYQQVIDSLRKITILLN